MIGAALGFGDYMVHFKMPWLEVCVATITEAALTYCGKFQTDTLPGN